ncbi:MAG: sensor histidine kinase [Ferruginibacter sp.]|nr:sensor histidine kinase [Ferruginibacter sp.]
MFSKKNFSPRQLSVICALIISVPIALLLLILVPNKWLSLISWAVIFFGSYFLISYTIDSFVYRQIKLIYKIISQTKASKREEFYYKNLLPQKRIDEVTVDVEKWAQQKKNEIEMLQQNEVFRKEFLQNLSHELKTPIFSIQGYIDTLLNGALHNNEVNQKFLQSAERNIERLVNLVDDLDEISKLESGELKLNCRNFIIQDLVKDVFDSLLIKIKEREISCAIKKGSEQSLAVYADKEKIRQVIINLVDNAIKYGKQNGTIEAGFYKMENKTIMIEITDNGSGIAEEHRLRIFERFYRTDLARSRKVGGSGLGLAICKHIIEAHEQKIEVRSTIDVGTTFHFFLATGK